MNGLALFLELQTQRIKQQLLTVPFQPAPKPRTDVPPRPFKQHVWSGDVKHGTNYAYNKLKCRCGWCKDAKAAYWRVFRARRKTRES